MRRKEKENMAKSEKDKASKKRAADGTHHEEPPCQKPRIEHEVEDSDDEDFDILLDDYADADDFFSDLRDSLRNSGSIEIHARYPLERDRDITPRDRVAMIAKEIWSVTGVQDHRRTGQNGHQTRLWCSQDAGHKKAAKPSTKEAAKHRDTLGMKRYNCQSHLTIRYHDEPKRTYAEIILHHHIRHVRYLDVSMPPEAKSMIEEQAERATPSSLAVHIRQAYPHVSRDQIYRAWRELSEVHWKRDSCQIKSTTMLLKEFADDVDIFELRNLPAKVEAVAWGMKKIAGLLGDGIVEIGMDATYDTNSKHLELYSIMAEHDNAGFPISYCLLTTATAIDIGKRKKALTAWAQCVRDKYNINPIFTHVDKDLGKIAALRAVWKSKVSLCWWHLRRAVNARLAKMKLATTAYVVDRARSEFAFISRDFVPPNKKVDVEDYEGGMPDDVRVDEDSRVTENIPGRPRGLPQAHPLLLAPLAESTNMLRIRLPPPSQPIDFSEEHDNGHLPPAEQPRIQGTGFTLLLQPAIEQGSAETPDGGDVNSDTDSEAHTRRTFCPTDLRKTIIDMMERHYCAHPDIPGHAAPNAAAIKRWAVQQMYNFCYNNKLPELWAYLWENWYRSGRWELWAREPKLASTYYIKLDNLLTPNGRYRELGSWRKAFKKTWRKLETRETTLPANLDAYRPNTQKWVCTCPAFVTSRFLLCKHLVQLVRRVPPKFFLEVKRQRSTPFWEHRTLKPKDAAECDGDNEGHSGDMSDDELPYDDDDDDDDDDMQGLDDEDDDDDDVNDVVGRVEKGLTFNEALSADINLITDFLAGLQFQLQFRDHRFLRTLEREGAGFFRLASACLEKEKRARKRGGNTQPTWDKAAASSMFYRPRVDGTEDE
ncbi:hypothetical protein D9619_008106 [Psilocybe cf. subviscida]|uniref:SWIM-type domain-containing protein n=1 Tax=Psilocybe cf. subviscida TaxID=2480587 RepID=A0A8H5AUB1_9AGAR|nr:hypothetical protein D9619_008106 [Psilocybe cf. subviscida]